MHQDYIFQNVVKKEFDVIGEFTTLTDIIYFYNFLLKLLYSPKVVVIVVKKRINNRFFMQSRSGLSNPPPGTVIDSVVTRPDL